MSHPPPEARVRLAIDAPIDAVWRLLTDVGGYPGWNPFVVRVDGRADRPGARFLLHVRWPDGGGTTAGETLTVLDAPAAGPDGVRRATFAYRYTETMSALGLVRGVRTQTLEQAPGGPTVYASTEVFAGLLARFIPLPRVQAGMETMARALRTHAEAKAKASAAPAPSERSVVVTGAAGGIGRASVRALATMGCRVVCAVRSEPSAEALREAILRELPVARIETVTGDLARLDAVRALAAEVARRGPVDTLVLNAGVVTAAPRDTADGLDEMLVVNHLSGFLLTAALWPVLLRGPSPRVVTVSSLMHGWGRVDPTDLGGRRGPWLGGWPQYARTKQMNVLFARELARRHAGGPVTCNALHPGSYGTGLQRGSRLSPVLHAALPGADRAGRGVVRLATSPELEGVTGGYFDVERIAAPSVLTRDTTIAAAVWEESARLVGVSPDWPV